jgi:hypothetical protein
MAEIASRLGLLVRLTSIGFLRVYLSMLTTSITDPVENQVRIRLSKMYQPICSTSVIIYLKQYFT